ncbi:hypothetical protein [Isachenkonia alkalipeptolytica]|uniref:Uncharacterized protein n=1 Tax=Isachenkonia alkalipeptolytica TaxID=2565777 RepID=A0AA43XJ02_9CLOT|nr:hypothetical protein [Isachenkonia alkalipeptolytica]NBG87715.1 hypothetical protein [Isachenkonia alkalipeptolytica]
MFKKLFMLLLILTILLVAGACGEAEEAPEGDDNGESAALEDDEAQDDPVDEEEDEGDDGEKGKEDSPELLDEIEADWTAEIDFKAFDVKDWLFTEEEVHFLYEKEGALYYQSLDLSNGDVLDNKKMEDVLTPEHFEILRDISIELHEFNNRLYGIIGQNDYITDVRWDQFPEELQQEQRMMIIDIENNETILSKTPMIDELRLPDTGITGESNIYPGFLFDVTADGRYVMILNSAPGMSLWENHLYYSTNQNEEELQEKNKEVLKQFEDAPLWVYDLQEDELLEIPYKDSIDVLVPYHVQGLENGINMIFTEQEGWLTLDIEEETVEKTGEGGIYRRTEPRVPGVEQYRDGEMFGENLFFTDVQETAEGIGAVLVHHYLWDFSGEGLDFSGIIGLNRDNQYYYYNEVTKEIVVNSGEAINDGEDRVFKERIYRFTIDEEKLSENVEDEPVETLKELKGFEVTDIMEFEVGTYQEGNFRLSYMGESTSIAKQIIDFHHLEYGVLAGSTIERGSTENSPFFYAYRDDEGDKNMVEVGSAELVVTTETHLYRFKGEDLRAYSITGFFEEVEKR